MGNVLNLFDDSEQGKLNREYVLTALENDDDVALKKFIDGNRIAYNIALRRKANKK